MSSTQSMWRPCKPLASQQKHACTHTHMWFSIDVSASANVYHNACNMMIFTKATLPFHLSTQHPPLRNPSFPLIYLSLYCQLAESLTSEIIISTTDFKIFQHFQWKLSSDFGSQFHLHFDGRNWCLCIHKNYWDQKISQVTFFYFFISFGCTGLHCRMQTLFSCPSAYGVLVPQPGIKPAFLVLEGTFLTPGPQGKSPGNLLKY